MSCFPFCAATSSLYVSLQSHMHGISSAFFPLCRILILGSPRRLFVLLHVPYCIRLSWWYTGCCRRPFVVSSSNVIRKCGCKSKYLRHGNGNDNGANNLNILFILPELGKRSAAHGKRLKRNKLWNAGAHLPAPRTHSPTQIRENIFCILCMLVCSAVGAGAVVLQ